jgi:hypothetical protein
MNSQSKVNECGRKYLMAEIGTENVGIANRKMDVGSIHYSETLQLDLLQEFAIRAMHADWYLVRIANAGVQLFLLHHILDRVTLCE